jgi:hypothetical protein
MKYDLRQNLIHSQSILKNKKNGNNTTLFLSMRQLCFYRHFVPDGTVFIENYLLLHLKCLPPLFGCLVPHFGCLPPLFRCLPPLFGYFRQFFGYLVPNFGCLVPLFACMYVKHGIFIRQFAFITCV